MDFNKDNGGHDIQPHMTKRCTSRTTLQPEHSSHRKRRWSWDTDCSGSIPSILDKLLRFVLRVHCPQKPAHLTARVSAQEGDDVRQNDESSIPFDDQLPGILPVQALHGSTRRLGLLALPFLLPGVPALDSFFRTIDSYLYVCASTSSGVGLCKYCSSKCSRRKASSSSIQI